MSSQAEQYKPMSVPEQVVSLYAAKRLHRQHRGGGCGPLERELLTYMQREHEILRPLRSRRR